MATLLFGHRLPGIILLSMQRAASGMGCIAAAWHGTSAQWQDDRRPSTMAQKDMPASRERRLRRAAARRGLAVRKLTRGQDRGRYQLIDPEFGTARPSPSRTHPTSFSLEEAEGYVDEP